MEVLRAASSD